MAVGEIVVVPTDTVYGLATVMSSEAVIQRLYAVRGGRGEPALPFLIDSADRMAELTRPTVTALRLAKRFWPGALTLILPPAASLPAYARAHPIAVRVANCPPLKPLLDAVGGHFLITGAIRSGYPPAITAHEASAFFREGVALILDGGPPPYGIPSTIVDCVPDPPVLIRRGAVPEDKLWEALGQEKAPESASGCS